MVAEIARRPLEQHHVVVWLQRRVWVFAAAWGFEDVAAVNLLAAQVAGLAGGAAALFELVVVGLELMVVDRPILQVHVRRDDLAAVFCHGPRVHLVLPLRPAPVQTGTMSAGASHALARPERAQTAHRQ